MKYRHSFHAGNFADVHKHITLLALLAALKRKEKGFLYLETHAGRGAYDLSTPSAETAGGIGRLLGTDTPAGAGGWSEELQQYRALLLESRAQRHNPHFYPGSPLLAAHELRPQDRAVFVELQGPEAHALEQALSSVAAAVPTDRSPRTGKSPRIRVERGDGFERLRAWLPPPERRGLAFIDPPYEQTRDDFERVTVAVGEALHRFQTGVIAVWYPIKDEREVGAWQARLAREIDVETLVSELWLYPRDSRVALNGSGVLIVNPPYLLAERMEVWLPQLQSQLDVGHQGGTRVHITGKSGHNG